MNGSDVLILFNLPAEAGAESSGSCTESDAGVLQEAQAVEEALAALGIRCRKAGVRSLEEVVGAVSGGRERLVVNLVESLQGRAAQACDVPAVCRSLGRRFTGSDSFCLGLTLDKNLAKWQLRSRGIRTPSWAVSVAGEPGQSGRDLAFPVIVKPLLADASEGIDAASVVQAPGPELVRAATRIHEQFGQDALIEEFVAGREFNISLLQRGGRVEMLPPAEIEFVGFPPGRPRIVDYAAKWLPESFEYRNTVRRIPAIVAETVAGELHSMARAAWEATGCRDYARVDFRLDEAGVPYVLEVNANPDISPDGGFAAALAAAGIEFREFVAVLLENASADRLPASAASFGAAVSGPFGIRCTEARDRDAIVGLLAATGYFRPDELAIAAEVIDEAVAPRDLPHYHSYTCERAGTPIGWVCWGQTPCTLGTFDLYWLAVSPSEQGRGIGKKLMQFAESRIQQEGGRIVVVETAGRLDYAPTRGFYTRIGYREEARLADFYAPGDDKVVFTKRLAGNGSEGDR
ncbi:MAG: GNAT family N-acetyltransferase [Acidobacteriota bacterium]